MFNNEADFRKSDEDKFSKHAKSRKRRRIFLIILFLILAVALTIVFLFSHKFFLKEAQSLKYFDYVSASAKKYDIEPAFIYAVIYTESNFQEKAVSRSGAIGLMQITKDTFEWLRKKRNDGPIDDSSLNDPQVNIDYGAYFLSILSSKYESERTVLCAYNAGIGTVAQWLSDPEVSKDGKNLSVIPYPETRNYVDKVLKCKNMYSRLYFQ
jgi:soluble lytic murein transglycosylase